MRLKRPYRHCICGYYWKLSRIQYIRLLFGNITMRCPKCNRLHEYQMTYFVNEVFKNTNKTNKDLVEGKRRNWRKC